jgi:hypothetical protein
MVLINNYVLSQMNVRKLYILDHVELAKTQHIRFCFEENET